MVKKGYKQKQEHKEKIKEKLEGNTNSLGRKLSYKTKKKIGEKNKINQIRWWKKNSPSEMQIKFQQKGIKERCNNCGIIIYNKNRNHNCEEIREKKRLKLIGKKQNEEHKNKIRLSNLGKHNKGKKRSKDKRLKISKGIREYYGKTENRLKMSLIRQKGNENIIPFKQALSKRLRGNRKYLEWRSEVFKRDNYHCQNCGEKGYLEAHHIVPISYLLSAFNIKNLDSALKFKALWDVGNGITYCRKCHILLDENIGKKETIINE